MFALIHATGVALISYSRIRNTELGHDQRRKAMAIASGSTQSRFTSGNEWLIWRSDWERGRQEIAARNEGESVAFQGALAAGDEHSKPEAKGQRRDGIENVYSVTLNDQETGLSFRTGIYGYGPTRPMTEADKQAHFLKQIEAAIVARRQGN
jgi:hypothetical protein